MKTSKTAGLLLAGITSIALAGCSYIKREEYDAQIAALKSADASMQSSIAAIRGELDAVSAELKTRFSEYDSKISNLEGRVRVDMTAHFDYDDATLHDADKPALNDFASVLSQHGSDLVVTVEGFTDPAGSAEYNKRLGQKRADAVRDYLVNTAGLSADSVRAVSYGEDPKRLVAPGAWGDSGASNRRVALVIDHVSTMGGDSGAM